MAMILEITCTKCGKKTNVYHAPGFEIPSMCDECLRKEKEEHKRDYLTECSKLPLEERLAKIEEWIYDHKQKRHYSPPLRF